MYSTVKALFFIFIATGILLFSYSQQRDSVIVKKSLNTPDSIRYITANKDSIVAQDSLALMKKKFDLFKYGDVISIANRLLLKKAPFNRADIIDIYKLKGISHYSLSEDDAAKKSFIEILRMDTSYTFDSTKVSPKIISFFQQVKENYIQQQKEIEARTVVRIDTVYVPQIEYDIEHESRLKNAIARSLLVPGLGHLYLKTNFKSVFLTVLGSASLISSVYFVIKTEEDEKAYVVETDPGIIEKKYDQYNRTFMKRNISLITFGVIWVYSQLDLLFFSNDEQGRTILKNTSMNYDNLRGLTFNLSYSF